MSLNKSENTTNNKHIKESKATKQAIAIAKHKSNVLLFESQKQDLINRWLINENWIILQIKLKWQQFVLRIGKNAYKKSILVHWDYDTAFKHILDKFCRFNGIPASSPIKKWLFNNRNKY